MYLCNCMPGALTWQKKSSELLELELQMVFDFYVDAEHQNPSPLKEQQVLLTAKKTLQLQACLAFYEL